MVALLIALGVAVVVLLGTTLRLAGRQRVTQMDAEAQARAPGETRQPADAQPSRTANAQPSQTANAQPSQTANAQPSRTANVAVLTRYEIWMRRIRREQLGVWDENWTDLSGTAQYAAWRQLAEARGAIDHVPGPLAESRGAPADRPGAPAQTPAALAKTRAAPNETRAAPAKTRAAPAKTRAAPAETRAAAANVQRYLARSLLAEVVYAAGGVERELGRLRKALADVPKSASEAAIRPAHPREERLKVGSYGADPAIREASYSFVNLLSWARATVERTDRRYRPGSPERAGLLPALAEGPLRDSVAASLQHLMAALRDSRFLAEYAVHAGAVPGGARGAEILPDGRAVARVPDPLADPLLTREPFEFTQDRDMLTYATELTTAVETFVDSALDAFAANRPARAGPLPR